MVHRISTIFVTILRNVLPFSLSVSHEGTVEFSEVRSDEVITDSNGMCAAVFLFFKKFSDVTLI